MNNVTIYTVHKIIYSVTLSLYQMKCYDKVRKTYIHYDTKHRCTHSIMTPNTGTPTVLQHESLDT